MWNPYQVSKPPPTKPKPAAALGSPCCGSKKPAPPHDADALLPPETIRPTAYEVHLVLAGPPRWSFEGVVDIRVVVGVPIKSFLLHAADLSIVAARLIATDVQAQVTKASRQIICLEFPRVLPVGKHGIRLRFSGSIGSNRRVGLYCCQWSGQADSWLVATHFEPANCRRVIPCFDLPHFKAPFALTLMTRDLPNAAISNTEIQAQGWEDEVGGVSLGPVGQGLLSQWRARSSLEASPSRLHVTRFHATPPLPTYVLGFWVGHFERLAVGQGPELRMAVPPGRGAEAGFAADWAARALGFYSQLLDMRLPLSKVDVLALPVMQGVGMEGFGAITVQQEYCLVGPHTDPLRRRRIARLLCHEMSHQWLGNLATPYSFDELWLKESTARLLEYMAIDALDHQGRAPGSAWPLFLTEVMYMAMQADAASGSHAVVQKHNGDLARIAESFDVITYGKGASLLRMLREHLGPEAFVAGIRRFLRTHLYASASTQDLWAALQEEAAAAEVVSVAELMEPWLMRPGCLALRVRLRQDGAGGPQLLLWQEPFRLLGEHAQARAVVGVPDGPTAGVKERRIPLKLRVGSGGGGGGASHTLSVWVGEGAPVEVDLGPYVGRGEPWLCVNHSHAGYFVTLYEGDGAWAAARRALEGGRLGDVEKTGLVCDLMLASHAEQRGGGVGGGAELGRLLEVVALLDRGGERGRTAWATAQTFVWEVRMRGVLGRLEEALALDSRLAADTPLPAAATAASLGPSCVGVGLGAVVVEAEGLREEVGDRSRWVEGALAAARVQGADEGHLEEAAIKLRGILERVGRLCSRVQAARHCVSGAVAGLVGDQPPVAMPAVRERTSVCT